MFWIQLNDTSEMETSLKSQKRIEQKSGWLTVKGKVAVITVELVDESLENANEEIRRDLIEWFREDAVLMPWAKEVKSIVIKEEPWRLQKPMRFARK